MGKMGRKAALLWDESYIWGLMSVRAFNDCRLPFDIVTARDISGGLPDEYGLLFVPGGWASNKIKSLGDNGIKAVKEFVYNGGLYVGLCGGAGLATANGIGLVDVKRVPTAMRVPSLSGPILIKYDSHPIFEGLQDRRFHVWWPSQFIVNPEGCTTLATYEEVFDDAFTSDLSVGSVRRYFDWHELEDLYGINLDPQRLIGEPLLLEGLYGKGKAILSLIHLDTPGDKNGQRLLRNIWKYAGVSNDWGGCSKQRLPTSNSSIVIEDVVQRLIDYGIENFLWFWRNDMLLQWRRGIRGLECCNLYILVKELCRLIRSCTDASIYRQQLSEIQEMLIPFVEDMKRLLFFEMLEMQRARITYERTENGEIIALRDRLFSRSKSYGGRYKSLIEKIDLLVLKIIAPKNL